MNQMVGYSKASGFSRLIARLFRAREIIFRSDGEIKYFNLSRGVLILISGFVLIVSGWTAFATLGFFNQLVELEAKNTAVWNSQKAYRQLLDQVSDYQASILNITQDLKRTQTHLWTQFEKNENLKTSLNSTENALKITEAERDQFSAIKRSLSEQFENLGAELRFITSKNTALHNHVGDLRGNLKAVKLEKAELAADRAKLGGRLWELNNELQSSILQRERLEKTIASMRGDLREAVISWNAIKTEKAALEKRLLKSEKGLETEVARHKKELEKISERASNNIDALERVLRKTGLNLEQIAPLPKDTIRGVGGPFIPYHPDMRPTSENDDIAADLNVQLDRWEKLRDVVANIPLVSPVGKKSYVSSRFGRRKDPFNRRWAMHTGLDIVAPYKSPVRVTAPGKVIFAARRYRYGRTVDVRHLNGLMTRYSHLSAITVKKGQRVELGDTVGLLGNTGRSTGPHLHYEIRHLDRALNPRKFLRATKNVQQ